MCACEIQQKNQEREGQQLLVSRSAQEALSGAGFCFFQPLVSNRTSVSFPFFFFPRNNQALSRNHTERAIGLFTQLWVGR